MTCKRPLPKVSPTRAAPRGDRARAAARPALVGHPVRVDEANAVEQLAMIERLLDEGVGRQGSEDLTLVQRVEDVIEGFNSWCDLAIKRLHQIHRLNNEECEFCAKYLDGDA